MLTTEISGGSLGDGEQERLKKQPHDLLFGLLKST